MTSCQVVPTSGTTATNFVIYTVYTDADNEGPGTEDDSYVRVVIDGVVYDLDHTASPPYTSGIWFATGWTGFSVGTHYYHFECWDGWTVMRYPTSGESSFTVTS